MAIGGSGTGNAQDASLQAIIASLGGAAATSTWVPRGGVTLNSLVAKASPGTLVEVHITNENAAATANRWLMIFDAIAVPANGTVPLMMPYLIAPQSFIAIFNLGLVCLTGITLAISTTNTTLTISADAPGTASITARIT